MKCKIFICAAFMLLLCGLSASAQQKPEEPDVFEQAEIQADRLQELLDLEDWQTFYVDSILKHDFTEMIAELEGMQAAKVSNSKMYMSVQDKWWDQIDASYKKIFTEEQWAAYLKSGALKAQKARAKRKAKAEGK